MRHASKDQNMVDFLQEKVSPTKRGDAAWIYWNLRSGDQGRFRPLNRQDARDVVMRTCK